MTLEPGEWVRWVEAPRVAMVYLISMLELLLPEHEHALGDGPLGQKLQVAWDAVSFQCSSLLQERVAVPPRHPSQQHQERQWLNPNTLLSANNHGGGPAY
jgi:hypothetical protein